MSHDRTRIFAFDAGKSTGLAVLDIYPDGYDLAHQEQYVKEDFIETAEHLLVGIDFWEPAPGWKYALVGEQFDLRPHNQFVADLTPVRVNAIVSYTQGGIDGQVWQTPGQAKGLVSDDVLKRLKMWPTGKDVNQPDADDVRDALRHAIYYAVKAIKHRPLIEAGWPRE